MAPCVFSLKMQGCLCRSQSKHHKESIWPVLVLWILSAKQILKSVLSNVWLAASEVLPSLVWDNFSSKYVCVCLTKI